MTPSKGAGKSETPDGTVRVWSSFGLSLPIGDSYAHFKCDFGHERIAKSSKKSDIDNVADAIDSYNEERLLGIIERYSEIVKDAVEEVENSTVKGRAKKRMRQQ